MYYIVHNDNHSMAAHSPEVIVKLFKNCHISNALDETDDDMLWNKSEEDGDVVRACAHACVREREG
jgi:hypothetical protein